MKRLLFFLGSVLLATFVLGSHTVANAIIFVDDPDGAWAYSTLRPSGSSSTTFFATDRSQFAGAVFQGYVTQEISDAGIPFFRVDSESSKFHVFSTFVLSLEDLEVDLRINGDDGHSIFLDDEFLGGAGYSVPVDVTITLEAGTPRRLEVVGHNAFGPSDFKIGEPMPDRPDPGPPIEQNPAILIHAEGDFLFIFDRLELQKALLTFIHPGWDGFHFSAEYDLGENSDGIDPAAEDVTISFGTYTETIPAGSFVCTDHHCEYDSRGPGIDHATMNTGFMEVRARHVDLAGTANPIEIGVRIGNDTGMTVAQLSGKLMLCGLGFELAFLIPPLMWLHQRRRRRLQ